jgi:hypothetical protein
MADKTKEDYMVDYIKSIATIEDCILPYREQRKDLRKSYTDNGWLDKDDIKNALRAYRLMKQSVDFEELRQVYRTLNGDKQIADSMPEED